MPRARTRWILCYSLILQAVLCHADDEIVAPSMAISDTKEAFAAAVRASNDEALDALTFELSYDDGVLAAVELSCAASDTELCIVEFTDDSICASLVFDANGLPVRANFPRPIAVIEFEILEPRPDSTILDIVEGAEFTTVDAERIEPAIFDGDIDFVEITFRRGDVDGDGTVFALADAVFLLQWGFIGGDEPPCLAAADVDGNERVLSIVDTIHLLNWAIANGPEPPTPGPFECGAGNEADLDLGCETDTC